MRVTALEINAHLENVTNFTIGPDFKFFMKFKCDNCNAESENDMAFPLEANVPILNGKANVNLSFKCKECKRPSTVNILDGSLRPYTADDDLTFKPFIEMDCRGCSPISFSPLANFACKNVESGRQFTEVDLSSDDWADYDEASGQTVGVYEFKHQFSSYKK